MGVSVLNYRAISRRAFIQGTMALGCVTGLGVAAYSREIEPQELSVERRKIFLPRILPELDGFTVALLSDFHYGAYVDHLLKSAVQVINHAEPDIVLLAGDFVTRHDNNLDHLTRDAHACGQILSGLRARCGVMAVLGNHDHSGPPEIVVESLAYSGIPVLRNSAVAVQRNNSRLWIGGIDDVLQGKPDLARTFKGVPPSDPNILLAHEPDYADHVSRTHPVDLQLSGHSHGGQVRFPFLGAPVLPRMAENYPMGWYRVGGVQLYTSRGLGMIGPRVRFNCPPELTFLTLHSSKVRS
jgi:predicted MPP superfamily phosphohydrolase